MAKTKGKKEKKDKKDKDAPKRAISAFFYYQKERRESLKKEQPNLDNKALISKMSEEWNKMKEPEKTKYNNLAAKDKERYEKEKKLYESKKGKKSGTKSAKKDE